MKKICLLLFLAIMALPLASIAQTGFLVSGSVTYKNSRKPLVGVSLHLLNTDVGTITDLKGHYSIQVKNGRTDTISFTYLACKTQKIGINNRHQINVQMEDNPAARIPIVVLTCGCGVLRANAKVDSASATTNPDHPNKGGKRH